MLFDKLKVMSNVLTKKLDQVEVVPNKCLKVRAVTSSCSACVDVCPKNSIELKLDSIELNDSCINCGLCTTVCLTNALKWNAPPLIQLNNQVIRLAESEEIVYIACSAVAKGNLHANVIEVPCLGMLPSAFWLSVRLNATNVQILHQSGCCRTCHISTGEALFMKQLEEAEQYLNEKMTICSTIDAESAGSKEIVDHSRRRLFTSLFEDVNELNTLTAKEVFEVEKTLTPFERFDQYYKQQSEVEELVEEVNEIKDYAVDKLLNDTVIHSDKNALLFKEFTKNPTLQQQMTFLMPEMKESCTRCGACAFLCPTNAITMHNGGMILSTNKCVSCGLCEEICYEKHIQLKPKNGTIFNEKFVYLLKEK